MPTCSIRSRCLHPGAQAWQQPRLVSDKVRKAVTTTLLASVCRSRGDSFRTCTYSQYVEVVFITAGCYPFKHGFESSQIQTVPGYSACNPTSLGNVVRKPSRIREKASINRRPSTRVGRRLGGGNVKFSRAPDAIWSARRLSTA